MEQELMFLPPSVVANKLTEYVDYHKTIGETNIEVGGYIRVSTAKESQQSSIENQKKILAEWANVNGYKLVSYYIDVKSGAYIYLRNEMQQLKEDIKTGKIKGVLTKEIARTSRDIMDIIELKRNLASYGSFIISLKENYDSRTDDDEFLLVIHAGLAQKERKTTASRIKVTQLLKAKEGKTNVSSPAFGYRLTKDKQHLEIEPSHANVYRRIVERFLEGWGTLKICQWLNKEDIPPKRGKVWHTNSIKAILINPVYLGITIYNVTTLVRDQNGKQKRVVRPKEEWIFRHNTHPNLISEEEFQRIQKIIERKSIKKTKEWSNDKKYLLSGLLYCSICGCKIYGTKQKGNTKNATESFFYFYVDQNRRGICDTKSKYWNMKKVESLVITKTKEFFKREQELLENRIKTRAYLYDKSQDKSKIKIEGLNKELNHINNAIKKQQEAFEKGAILIDEYGERMTELRQQKKEINEKLDDLSKKLDSFDSIHFKYMKLRDGVFELIHNIENLDYKTLNIIIRKLYKRILISSDYSLKFEYTFEDN